MRDRALYEHVDEIENNGYKSVTVSDCIRIMEAKLLGTNLKRMKCTPVHPSH